MNLSSYIRHRQKMWSSPTYTKNEYYALCFYLYNLFLNMKDRYIVDEISFAITAFLDYTKALNKTERLSKILTSEIKNFERQNLLTPLLPSVNEDMTFDSSDIKYCYEEDKMIYLHLEAMIMWMKFL